ncbi:hypothetical protein GCM10009127_00810 [Alteraurantiacibacter aestuarii]
MVYTQSGPWSLDFGDDYCQLASIYSNGDNEIALALERNRADNSVRMILVSDSIRTFRAADQIGYSYLPSGGERTARYIKSETPDGRDYFNFGNIIIGPDPFAGFGAGGPGGPGGPGPGPGGPPPGAGAGAQGADAPFVQPPYDRAAELEFAAGINGIAFDEGLLRGFSLQTGSLRAPLEALQTCMDDLLVTWGLDYEKHRTMTRRAAPVGQAFEWIPRGTVGFQEFGAFGGARNPFRVMIDAQGKPTSCTVHWPSLAERKNEAICKGIMENGSFTPALDADGQPMASYWMVDYVFGLNRPFGQ